MLDSLVMPTTPDTPPQPSMADRPRRVRIAADLSTAVVEIEGHLIDPKSLIGYDVQHRAGQLAQVVLYGSGVEEAAFDGLARVVVGQPVDSAQETVRFLRAIDPAELERVALQRLSWAQSDQTVTGAVLDQLVDWAEGR